MMSDERHYANYVRAIFFVKALFTSKYALQEVAAASYNHAERDSYLINPHRENIYTITCAGVSRFPVIFHGLKVSLSFALSHAAAPSTCFSSRQIFPPNHVKSATPIV